MQNGVLDHSRKGLKRKGLLYRPHLPALPFHLLTQKNWGLFFFSLGHCVQLCSWFWLYLRSWQFFDILYQLNGIFKVHNAPSGTAEWHSPAVGRHFVEILSWAQGNQSSAMVYPQDNGQECNFYALVLDLSGIRKLLWGVYLQKRIVWI